MVHLATIVVEVKNDGNFNGFVAVFFSALDVGSHTNDAGMGGCGSFRQRGVFGSDKPYKLSGNVPSAQC